MLHFPASIAISALCGFGHSSSQLVSEGEGWRDLFTSTHFPVQVFLCGVARLPLQFVICFYTRSVIPLTTINFQAVSLCFADNKIRCK